MAKNGRSERNIFGDGYDHYDASGNKKGSSERNLFGAVIQIIPKIRDAVFLC